MGYPGFWWRVGLLTAVLVLVALVEWIVRRDRAQRWREYGFLVIASTVGAGFGIAVDQVTARISPEYFLYGKGLAFDRFAGLVVDLGARAGLTAGAIASGVLLLAGSRRDGINRVWSAPGRLLALPFAASAAAAVVLGAAFATPLSETLFPGYREFLSEQEWREFRTVAGAHYGLYLGGIGGTILSVLRMRRSGRQDETPNEA